MRKIFNVLLIPLLYISSCNLSKDRVWVCQINASIELQDGSLESLYLEEDNERFIWSRTAEENVKGVFDFYFWDEENCYYNSDEFRYENSLDKEIVFDCSEDNEYFSFEGSTTIFIYYDNSSNVIKNIIKSAVYNIDIGGRHWFSEPGI